MDGSFFKGPSGFFRGHVDGFYAPDRAQAALESRDPKQVAELLETPPWNPTMQEMCLGG